jgi:hypothetical protein
MLLGYQIKKGEMAMLYVWEGWQIHIKFLSEKPEGKRPLARPTHRLEDDIKIDLAEVGYEIMEWINMAQDRDQQQAPVNMVMNLWVP